MATSERSFRTLIIGKRGRKYFACELLPEHGSKKAKLVINEVSEGLQAGQTVTLEVNDLTDYGTGRYGLSRVYEPIAIFDPAEAKHIEEGQKWLLNATRNLQFSEHAVSQGKSMSTCFRSLEAAMIGLKREYPHLIQPKFQARVDAVFAAQAAIDKRYREERAERDRIKQKERLERERLAEVRRNQRALFPVSNPPIMGRPVLWENKAVVFGKPGVTFPIATSHKAYGWHLRGYEDEEGAYYYWDASDAPLEGLEPAFVNRKLEVEGCEEVRLDLGEEGSIVLHGGRWVEVVKRHSTSHRTQIYSDIEGDMVWTYATLVSCWIRPVSDEVAQERQQQSDELEAASKRFWAAVKWFDELSNTLDDQPDRVQSIQGLSVDCVGEPFYSWEKKYDSCQMVLDEEGYAWFISYNGRDGDCWDFNNFGSTHIATRRKLSCAEAASFREMASAVEGLKSQAQAWRTHLMEQKSLERFNRNNGYVQPDPDHDPLY